MANQNKPRLSLKGEANVQTTEPIAQPPAEPNAPSQETKMEAEQNPETAAAVDTSLEAPREKSPEENELTAKQLALAEEENAVRAQKIINGQQARLEAEMQQPVSIIGLAAQGREALLDGLRQHADRNKPVEHVPPPRTPRQMEQLEAELSRGRSVQQKAAAQQASRPVPEKVANEGFTTPVHRPGDFVPNLNSRDPAIR